MQNTDAQGEKLHPRTPWTFPNVLYLGAGLGDLWPTYSNGDSWQTSPGNFESEGGVSQHSNINRRMTGALELVRHRGNDPDPQCGIGLTRVSFSQARRPCDRDGGKHSSVSFQIDYSAPALQISRPGSRGFQASASLPRLPKKKRNPNQTALRKPRRPKSDGHHGDRPALLRWSLPSPHLFRVSSNPPLSMTA